MTLAAVFLLTLAAFQTPIAHTDVAGWAATERAEEQVMREAAARVAGGCNVETTGSIVEMASALPVLIPLADERSRACDGHQRFIVVFDGSHPTSTATNDRPIKACKPAVDAVDIKPLARILTCAP